MIENMAELCPVRVAIFEAVIFLLTKFVADNFIILFYCLLSALSSKVNTANSGNSNLSVPEITSTSI